MALFCGYQNWTAVCPLDSDHDGRTNGQELGDPNCTWKLGMASPSSSNLTHPGQSSSVHAPSNTCRRDKTVLSTLHTSDKSCVICAIYCIIT